MKHIISIALIAFMGIGMAWADNGYKVVSPGKSNSFVLNQNAEGHIVYSISSFGKSIIEDSHLGYSADGAPCKAVTIVPVEKKAKTVKDVWKPLWGKRSVVKDEYNAQAFTVTTADGKTMTIEVRAYDEGVAFRMSAKGEELKEATEFRFADNFTAWYYNGERHNRGPELLKDARGERLPLMTVKVDDDLFLAVHEACLGIDGWPMRLMADGGSTNLKIAQETIRPTGGEYTGAWRVVMTARKPGGLVDSHLLELLNPDAEGDFSWVTPGVDLWDWRIDGAVWDGYHYGMNYDSWTRMIDFASEQGFRNLVLDANWYGPEFEKNSNPTTGDKAKDVQRIIQYGKEKGVGLWLYLNDVAGSNYPIEETLAQYEKWGAAGVKYGFMGGNPQEKNRKTQEITALCAKHHLMVDYHDYPIHPFGQMRTWPNAVTREFCKAQLDGRDIFQPKTFVTSTFVNMVAGPIDQNNGFMELHQGRTTRKDNNQEVPSTAASEIARTMITWSGATIIPDIPEYYRKYPTLLEFLSAEKQPWQESITLDGEIGEYIVMARQNRDGQWLIAAASNETARKLSIPLSFLPKKSHFTAAITTDADSLTNFRTDRERTAYREEAVTEKSVITVDIASGGGCCILLK